MSRSSEAYQEQEERENLSGSDDYEAWIASMENKQAEEENENKRNNQ